MNRVALGGRKPQMHIHSDLLWEHEFARERLDGALYLDLHAGAQEYDHFLQTYEQRHATCHEISVWFLIQGDDCPLILFDRDALRTGGGAHGIPHGESYLSLQRAPPDDVQYAFYWPLMPPGAAFVWDSGSLDDLPVAAYDIPSPSHPEYGEQVKHVLNQRQGPLPILHVSAKNVCVRHSSLRRTGLMILQPSGNVPRWSIEVHLLVWRRVL
jgi:hypothetical protein